MALLLIMVGTMFTLLLTPIVLAQINTSKVDTRRGHSLDAAQAGVDIALGHIRDANNGSGLGVLASLPCNTFTGTVASGGTARYEAKVYYFSQDPRGHADWINDSTKQIGCISSTSGLPLTPRYAVVVSRGTNSATGSLDTVPTRHDAGDLCVQNNNVPGGLIHSYNSSPDLCGRRVHLARPRHGGDLRAARPRPDQQLWSFNTNLTNQPGEQRHTRRRPGICLDAPSPHAANEPFGQQARPRPSAPAVDLHRQHQLPGYDRHQAPSTTPAATCRAPTPSRRASSSACGGRNTAHGFVRAVGVGAGRGRPATVLVDFNQFGRCRTSRRARRGHHAILITYRASRRRIRACRDQPAVDPPSRSPHTFTSAVGVITSVMERVTAC